MRLITTTAELELFCDHILETREASQNFITVDTEFQRDKTYYPKLCLIQVATADETIVIDPLAPDMDLQSFYRILQTPEIMKVFHAGRQDIEIFHLLTGQIPYPIFDTQIAAMVCGFGESVSYEALVQHYVGQSLDKSMQRADWCRRPLSERQLAYAADDVLHLRKVYYVMRDYLIKSQRMTWFEEELQILQNLETFQIDEAQLWRRLKLKNPRPELLVRLQALAIEREKLARYYDQPRGRIMDDETLIDLASFSYRQVETVPTRISARFKSLPKETLGNWIDSMQLAMQKPNEDWPKLPTYKSFKTAPPQLQIFLEYFLNLRADQLKIVTRLLAIKEELTQLATQGEDAPIRCLTGWRKEVFGLEALALIRGEIALKIEDKKVKTIPLMD